MARPDGRQDDALRPVSIELDFVDAPLASALIKFGRTTVLCAASLEEDVPRWLKYSDGPPRGWVTAEYAMLPSSTEERTRRERRGAKGRTYEIQRLIGRSLRAVIDLEKLGQRTITIDCDVLRADGGTRTASITGGFVALAMACQRLMELGLVKEMPLTHTLAAISCGKVDGEIVLDLPYVEDAAAEVDMNVVMTGDGRLIEVQGTGEEATFSRKELDALLDVAEKGIRDLTELQREALHTLGTPDVFAGLFG